MWKKGTVQLVSGEDLECKNCGYAGKFHNSTEWKFVECKDFVPVEAYAQLPHSCDEWVIGNKESVIGMIEDLQDVLKQM